MILLSFTELATLARLSSVAYAPSSAAVSALGMELINTIDSDEVSATIVRWSSYTVVAFQGTRITVNTDLAEIFDNIKVGPVAAPGGMASCGYWRPLAAIWPRIEGSLPTDKPLIYTGHSLGGVRAQLAPAFRPACVVSYGAPKGADSAFWRAWYGGDVTLFRIVHGHDFAPGWGGFWATQPTEMHWLYEGRCLTGDYQHPILNLSVADHAVETYIAALDALSTGASQRMAGLVHGWGS